MRTLILGGARSGKSAFAEQLAGDGPVLYVATARPSSEDLEFSSRIAAHAARRPQNWVTEEQDDVEKLLAQPDSRPVLIDDLGTWLTAATDECGAIAWEQDTPQLTQQINDLVASIAHYGGNDLLIVSPEVGLALVPEHRSGRLFRDRLGLLNQAVAHICDRVVLVVAGLPLELKNQPCSKNEE